MESVAFRAQRQLAHAAVPRRLSAHGSGKRNAPSYSTQKSKSTSCSTELSGHGVVLVSAFLKFANRKHSHHHTSLTALAKRQTVMETDCKLFALTNGDPSQMHCVNCCGRAVLACSHLSISLSLHMCVAASAASQTET